MKKYIAIISLVLILPGVQAQEENNEFKTLFGDKQISHGGYGAVSVNYSQIDGKDAIVMGGRGAWVIGHGIAIGFAGSGFLNDYHYNPNLSGGRNVNLAGGYGGLLIEPILFPKFPVHISIPVVAGVGGVAYTTSFNPYDWDDPQYFVEEASSFLVLEPGVELEFNVVRFFRLAIGGYYRLTSDIRLYDTSPDVLNGFSGGITLKFGKF
jgi:hypothetical protein